MDYILKIGNERYDKLTDFTGFRSTHKRGLQLVTSLMTRVDLFRYSVPDIIGSNIRGMEQL